MDFRKDFEKAADLENAGQKEQAVAIYKKILQQSPNQPSALFKMGEMAHKETNLDIAENFYLRSLEADQNQPEVWTSYASLLIELRRIDAAEKALRNARALDQEYPPVFHWAGVVEFIRGNPEAGLKIMEKGQQLSPEYVSFYPQLTKYKNFDSDSQVIQNIFKLLESSDLDKHDEASLHYSLVNFYEKKGNREKLWHHLQKANQAQRALSGEWREEILESFQQIKIEAEKSDLALKVPESEKHFTPIFILGMARTGSTLIEQILATSTEVFGGDELPFFTKFLGLISARKNKKPLPFGLSRLDLGDFTQVAQFYQARVSTLDPQARFITDKMPWNFQVIGPILAALPWAKIIHTRRNRMDCAYSIYRNAFTPKYPYFCDLDDLAYYFRLYEDLMDFWHEKFPGQILDVQYEEVVSDPENQIKKICEFCGIEWNPEMLEFHKTKREVRTLSQSQVSQPLYKKGIGKGKKFEKEMTPFLSGLEKYRKEMENPNG